VDLSAEMVALSQASLLAEVNLKVVETANELSSRTIDILA
jgi:flagellar basal body rod protein FlgC